MKTIQTISSAPLKMMIAGEWSVLQPGNHSVVTALNSRVTVTMARSVNMGWSLTTNHGQYLSDVKSPLSWKITDPYWELACTLLKVAAQSGTPSRVPILSILKPLLLAATGLVHRQPSALHWQQPLFQQSPYDHPTELKSCGWP